MSDPRSTSIIADVRVSPENFVLPRALSAAPETVVEFEQFVPTDGTAMPFLWVTGDDRSAFEEAIEADPTVADVTLLDSLGDDRLFEVEWDDVDNPLFVRFRRGDEGVLRAVGRADEWFLKVRFRDRTSLAGFREYCGEGDVDFTLLRLYETQSPKLGQYDLTVAQRSALVTALEMGYFDVPRQATLADIAAELDLSPNAVSERIRRGEANLFRSALTIDRPPRRRRFD